jgi:hypothetical protein
VKIRWLLVGFFLTLAATSQAGPRVGGGFGGRGFHGGFVSPHIAKFGGGGFRGANFANRRFFGRGRPIFFQQYGWPGYWYPYWDPLSYSYLEPDSDYQYWDNSATSAQPQSFAGAADHSPVVIVINTGNSRPTYAGSNPGYVDSGYVASSAVEQQRTVVQDPSQKPESRTDPVTPAAPAVPQATPVSAPNPQSYLQMQGGVFSKLVLVSWLEDGGKDVIFVKNIITNDVQRITSQPNIDHFRLVELHPNADPRQFEAIISNGSEQGAVRFRF